MLSEGTLEGGALVCRGHGWRFDPTSGTKLGDPTMCLKSFRAEIEDNHVMIDRGQVLDWKRLDSKEDASAPHKPVRSFDQLPGPKGLPLLGNSLQVDLKQLHLILERWSEFYGLMYTFRIGGKPMVVVAEPELVNGILRHRPESYRRMSSIESVLKEIGVNGVFSAEGENWRRQRRLVMQALDTRHLRQFFPTLTKVTRRLKKRWTQAANDGRPVEVQKDLMRYTVDVTTNLAFGYDMNTLEEEGDVIQQHLEKVLPVITRRMFAPFPYWRYVRLPADRALGGAIGEIHKAVGEFTAHSRQEIAQDPELAQRPDNLLQSLLVAGDEEHAQFDDEEVFSNAVTILMAGEDTTANTLAWMMHFLVEHPQVQSKLQAEVDAVLESADTLCTYDDARRLTYLEAVTHETMRLKPVAPLLALETNVDVELDGVHIPPQTSLILLTRLGALGERDFPRPHEFQPERWLSESRIRPVRHPTAFMPFGSGPRLCPGRSLALLEIKTAMAMVCRNFNLSQAGGLEQVGETFAFTMMPTDLFVTFGARNAT
jgi:cytochrome P450